ncbi:MAG: hydrogenase nickel incorporation protein HypA [Verrucomicrobia bacterium]|nr:hydrogenase nickel incorporation protein HypA [Verrucomicrobiota bacterium]
MFEFSTATVLYCVFVAITFLVLWIYYDRRDHRRFELERRKSTFHCIRCDHLYGAPGRAELARCPNCGHENVRLKF